MNSGRMALAVALVVASGVAGFLAYRRVAPAPARVAALPVRAAVAPASAAPTAAAPGAASPIPEEVPDLSLPDMSGRAHALRHNGGRPRLYNFWATWCEPCRREIPLLNTLQARYGRSDQLEIVGIAVDFQDAVAKFMASTALHYTSLVGEDKGLEAAQRFGMELALPFTVFADERNRIIAVKVGELHRDEADLILGQLRALRTGTTTLPAARALIGESLKALSLKRAKQSATS